MELVMRVLVEAEDEDIARWAEAEEAEITEIENDIKESVEKAVPCVTAKVNAKASFIEWEPEGCYPTYHKDVE